MDFVINLINDTLKELIYKKHSRKMVISREQRIIDDLGFTSLDVAELIACLESELGVDPFSEGASIRKTRTVADFYNIYTKSLGGDNFSP